MEIRPFQESDQAAVIELWKRCNLLRPWNDPTKDIRRKLGVQVAGRWYDDVPPSAFDGGW